MNSDKMVRQAKLQGKRCKHVERTVLGGQVSDGGASSAAELHKTCTTKLGGSHGSSKMAGTNSDSKQEHATRSASFGSKSKVYSSPQNAVNIYLNDLFGTLLQNTINLQNLKVLTMVCTTGFVVQRLGLALSKIPNKVAHLKTETHLVFQTLCSLVTSEFRTMDEVHKPSESDLEPRKGAITTGTCT
jgi:hypothetical protein